MLQNYNIQNLAKTKFPVHLQYVLVTVRKLQRFQIFGLTFWVQVIFTNMVVDKVFCRFKLQLSDSYVSPTDIYLVYSHQTKKILVKIPEKIKLFALYF